MDMDKLFDKVNRIPTTRGEIRNVTDLAVQGFIAIERIGKLLIYDDKQKINEVINDYMQMVEKCTKK